MCLTHNINIEFDRFTIINVHGLQRQMTASNRITLMKQSVYFIVSHTQNLSDSITRDSRVRARAREYICTQQGEIFLGPVMAMFLESRILCSR